MTRGTDEEFDKLHGLTLRIITKMMEAAEKGKLVDEEGHVTMPPPALLAQAIKFLKENGIDKPETKKDALRALREQLPNFEDDDPNSNVVPMRRL